jgi:trans-aconitate methyltransferase
LTPQNAFNKAAQSYDDQAFVQRFCAFRMASTIYSLFPQEKFFCDLGAGTGYLTEALMRFYDQAHFHLVDFAPAMIEETKKKFLDRCTYEVGDLFSSPFQGFPVSNFVFQWTNDIPAFARIAFTTLTKGTWGPWIKTAQKLDVKTHVFLSQRQWLNIVKEKYKNSYFFLEKHAFEYPSVIHFLKSVKKIGANGSFYEKQNILPVVREFSKKINVPYHVLYVIGWN